MSRSAGPVRRLRSSGHPTTTDPADPDRPTWKPGSGRSARPGFATATVAYMCCYGARGGRLIRRRRGVSIASQLRNKTPKRRVRAKLRDDRKDATQPNNTWAMDFVHDQLATKCGEWDTRPSPVCRPDGLLRKRSGLPGLRWARRDNVFCRTLFKSGQTRNQDRARWL